MASFTMELKNVIDACGGDIGMKDYPIFNESHRDVLNQKIIDHYWNMEIGIASIDDWRFVLNRTMREIMPRYNQLYKSELLNFDPLVTMDMKMITDSLAKSDSESTTDGTASTDSTGQTTGAGSNITASTGESDVAGSNDTESSSEQLANQQTGTDTKAKARAVSGSTPQKRLSGDMDYASSVADNTSDTSTDTDVTSSDTASSTVNQSTKSLDKNKSNVNQNTTSLDNSTSNVDGKTNVTSSDSNTDSNHSESASKGYSGSPSGLLMEFRATIMNIDMDIVEELSDLFMMIWSTGDQYTNNYRVRGYTNGFTSII